MEDLTGTPAVPPQLELNQPAAQPAGAMFAIPVLGVPIYIGIDILIATVLVGFAMVPAFQASEWAVWVGGWAAATVGAVLIHECAHAACTLVFRLGLRHIFVGVQGGHTMMLRPHPAWWQDFIVSVAGPLSNLATAAALWYWWMQSPADGVVADGIGYLFWVSLILGAFNLLPVLGMDGGRALQAICVPFSPDRGAAAGKARLAGAGLIGGVFGCAGLVSLASGSPVGGVMFIATGAWWGSSVWRSGHGHKQAGRLSLYTVADAMGPGIIVRPDHSARELIDARIKKYYSGEPVEAVPRPYVVMDASGRVHGLLTAKTLGELASEPGDWANLTVSDLMTPLARVPVVTPDTPSATAVVLSWEGETDGLLVMEEGELVGVLTQAHLEHLVRDEAA